MCHIFFSKLGTIEFYGRGSYKQNDDLKARWKIILSNLISSKKGVSIKNSGWPFSPRCGGGGLARLSLAVKFCEKVKLKFNFVSKISCEWPGIYIPLTVTKNRVVKFAHLCDNYVPQWWVELDDELSWLFTKSLRDFYLICRKYPNPSQNFCYSHSLNFHLSGST